MERNSRTFRLSPLTLRIGALVAALASAVALSGCKDDDNISIPPPTVGSLNVNVTPASASVVVTGPAGFAQQTFTGNKFLADLAPGQYTAKATAPLYVDETASINVVAGQTSSISLILKGTAPIIGAPRAVYRDGDGNLVPLDPASMQAGQFFFYAWLQDLPSGILPAELNSGTAGDPGKPLVTEQTESAPSFTQNLAAGWVGFMDPAGVVRPVIGADVRWEIDQYWFARFHSTLFGTSDDNRVALGYGIDNDQADTRTNNARLEVERFPFLTSEYPLFNNTGIVSPFVDGFTWVTLFSPDKEADARIVAVATITVDGVTTEIGKQILYKSFAPAPKIEITKTVSSDVVNLVGGTATVNWTVTIRNVGTGDATTVSLRDFLASGDGATYALGSLPAGSTPVGDGFTYTFPLASAFTPPPSQTTQLLGNAESFAVLAGSTVTNTGSSVVTGNVGVSASTAVTGFPPGLVVSGSIHNNDAVAQQAQTALTAAMVDLKARPCTGAPDSQPLSNQTVTPGVYCYAAALGLTGPLVLDAQGDPAAEFVFNIGSALTVEAGATVSLINGASPCNVYWVLGSSGTIKAGAFFAGNILATASITGVTGASLSGRALASTGGVSLDTNVVTAPLSCVPVPASAATVTFTATVTAPGTYCNGAEILSYSSATGTFTPVDLNSQACFTALESNLSIVKDFVADDNTTSLGKALTVAADVPAKLRVRVINSGTGDATGVQVADALTSGVLANYRLIGVAPGTPNAGGGFDNTVGGLAAGATATMLLTVAASVDGEYCDTATVTATSGTIGIGSDTACLTVATPKLEITKADAPASVLPGATYTSTIVVTNSGSATARNVVISDALGFNSALGVRVVYVSSSLNGVGGTLASNIVTAGAVDILAGESMTFTVVSRIPLGAASGTYCDQANASSSNAVSPAQVEACVTVPAFSALQTQLVDLKDPIAVGDDVTYFSVLYVEALSNEGVGHNVLTYSFGLTSPTGIGTPGVFDVTSTKVYLDSAPVRDPITGLVVSDATSPTAVLQTLGADYTLSAPQLGFQVITMSPNVALEPNTALYVVHVVHVPAATPANHLYTTSYIWDSFGLVVPAHTYEASSSEPTTVLP